MECQSCGRIYPDNAKFCKVCGIPLVKSEKTEIYPQNYIHNQKKQNTLNNNDFNPQYNKTLPQANTRSGNSSEVKSKPVGLNAFIILSFVLVFLILIGVFMFFFFDKSKHLFGALKNESISETNYNITEEEKEASDSYSSPTYNIYTEPTIPTNTEPTMPANNEYKPPSGTDLFDENGFIFADSNKRLLNRTEIEEKLINNTLDGEHTMQFIINEIYARYGAKFLMPRYFSHYESFEWYRNLEKYPLESVSADFNYYEVKNIALLVEISKERGYR